jgi:hypothetical protein
MQLLINNFYTHYKKVLCYISFHIFCKITEFFYTKTTNFSFTAIFIKNKVIAKSKQKKIIIF